MNLNDLKLPNKPRVNIHGKQTTVILSACRKAAVAAGWSKEQIDAVILEATKDDHPHLIQTIRMYFQTE